MLLILEIAMLIMGIVALIRGRFQLTRNRVCEGAGARLAGLIMILPLPLAFTVGFYIGANAVASGKNFDAREWGPKLAMIEAGLIVGCFLLAALIALATGQEPERDEYRPRRRYDPRRDDDRYDDDRYGDDRYVDRPRRGWDDEVPSVRPAPAADNDEHILVTPRAPAPAGRPQPLDADDAEPPRPRRRWDEEDEPARPRRPHPRDEDVGPPRRGIPTVVWFVGGALLFLCVVGAGVGGVVVYLNLTGSKNHPPVVQQAPPAFPEGGAGGKKGEGQGPGPGGKDNNPAQGKQDGKDKQQGGNDKQGGKDKKGGKEQPSTAASLPPLPAAVAIQPPAVQVATTYPLPSAARAVAVGGGGRFLVLQLTAEPQLAVFDVNEVKITFSVPLENDQDRFAAGMTKLLVYSPTKQRIQRWDLLTQEKEHEGPFPGLPPVVNFCMGCASDGPLLVSSKADPKLQFFDVLTLKNLQLPLPPDVSRLNFHRAPPIWPAANGRVFGSCARDGGSPSGVCCLVLEEGQVRCKYLHKTTWCVLPAPDGKTVFASDFGIFTSDLNPAPDIPEFFKPQEYRDRKLVPAARGPFYLQLHTDSPLGAAQKAPDEPKRGATLYMLGLQAPVARLPEVEVVLFKDLKTVKQIGWENTVHLVPRARLVIVLPATLDRLLLYPLDPLEALDKSGQKYVVVTSTPPTTFVPGQPFAYRMEARASGGKAQVALEAGPPGMKVTPDGQVAWQPPTDFAENRVDVILRVNGAERQTFHNFTLTAAPK
jgi:hypothetical protein